VKDVVLAGNLFQTSTASTTSPATSGGTRWAAVRQGRAVSASVTEGAPHVRIEEILVGGDV